MIYQGHIPNRTYQQKRAINTDFVCGLDVIEWVKIIELILRNQMSLKIWTSLTICDWVCVFFRNLDNCDNNSLDLEAEKIGLLSAPLITQIPTKKWYYEPFPVRAFWSSSLNRILWWPNFVWKWNKMPNTSDKTDGSENNSSRCCCPPHQSRNKCIFNSD